MSGPAAASRRGTSIQRTPETSVSYGGGAAVQYAAESVRRRVAGRRESPLIRSFDRIAVAGV